eukprot:TRINITY_DN1549_c0_g3_i1.p1 TRINITY_DN1549_c0_g3~~TRINITY_DN1549_c0_g3_i1.p1  ORF type:complete len:734 (+),score=91.88 TRINITY_DN1549_c0_g3_i1:99-2300(+)
MRFVCVLFLTLGVSVWSSPVCASLTGKLVNQQYPIESINSVRKQALWLELQDIVGDFFAQAEALGRVSPWTALSDSGVTPAEIQCSIVQSIYYANYAQDFPDRSVAIALDSSGIPSVGSLPDRDGQYGFFSQQNRDSCSLSAVAAAASIVIPHRLAIAISEIYWFGNSTHIDVASPRPYVYDLPLAKDGVLGAERLWTFAVRDALTIQVLNERDPRPPQSLYSRAVIFAEPSTTVNGSVLPEGSSFFASTGDMKVMCREVLGAPCSWIIGACGDDEACNTFVDHFVPAELAALVVWFYANVASLEGGSVPPYTGWSEEIAAFTQSADFGDVLPKWATGVGESVLLAACESRAFLLLSDEGMQANSPTCSAPCVGNHWTVLHGCTDAPSRGAGKKDCHIWSWGRIFISPCEYAGTWVSGVGQLPAGLEDGTSAAARQARLRRLSSSGSTPSSLVLTPKWTTLLCTETCCVGLCARLYASGTVVSGDTKCEERCILAGENFTAAGLLVLTNENGDALPCSAVADVDGVSECHDYQPRYVGVDNAKATTSQSQSVASVSGVCGHCSAPDPAKAPCAASDACFCESCASTGTRAGRATGAAVRNVARRECTTATCCDEFFASVACLGGTDASSGATCMCQGVAASCGVCASSSSKKGLLGLLGLLGIIPLVLCSALLVGLLIVCRRPRQKLSTPVMVPTVLPTMLPPPAFNQVTMVPCGAMSPPPIHNIGPQDPFCL